MAYVSIDGNYGAESHLEFEAHELTQSQWQTLEELSDGERYFYVRAILNNHDLSEWEQN